MDHNQREVPQEPVRLTSDFVFKYVFGSESSGGILRSFLSAVQTDAGLPPVAEVEIRNPFNLAHSSKNKTSIVDVRARDAEGTVYTIEVQALSEAAFRERALYYWAYAYAAQLGTRQDYKTLRPVVGVNIVDFRIFPETLPVHTTFHLAERDYGTVPLTPHLAIHFLELPKLHRQQNRAIVDADAGQTESAAISDATSDGSGASPAAVSTPLGRWLYYIDERGEKNAMEDDILLQILKEDPDIKDADERYRQFIADDELREQYQDRIKEERDRRSQIIFARDEGREQGREQGRVEGREQGRQEARVEARVDVARLMKARGDTTEKIAEVTGLSVAEIDAIE